MLVHFQVSHCRVVSCVLCVRRPPYLGRRQRFSDDLKRARLRRLGCVQQRRFALEVFRAQCISRLGSNGINIITKRSITGMHCLLNVTSVLEVIRTVYSNTGCHESHT